ncbi:MAG: sodium:proton antiporter [Acidimicrobiales bacterium]
MSNLMLASGGEVTPAIAVIAILGVASLWLGSRLRIPSILLLLPAGILAGPVLGLVEPDEQFGDLLFPLISLGVGILLFEGGLNLRWERTDEVRSVVFRLVTVGAFVTWVIGSIAAYLIFDITRGIAALLGAVLVVSGPTVVIPLLRLARPRRSVAEVLRWEGIVIDPVGATLGVVVLDAVIEDAGPVSSAVHVLYTLGSGLFVGLAAGGLLLWALRQHWIPDHLQNPLALATAIGAFAVSDMLRSEAGLMATTVIGLVLANQKIAPVRHILEFQEDLSYMVLGGLFLVLGARIEPSDLADVAIPALVLTLVLAVIARPLTVWTSTVRSGLTLRERAFLVGVAPRGIVAAAVSSVFALELEEAGRDPGPLASATFVVIIATVLLYGLSAVPMARLLHLARPADRAIAIVGGSQWHLDVAERLQEIGIPSIVFTDREIERRRARQRTILAFDGDLQSEEPEEAADALGVGTVLVLSDRTELATAVTSRLGHHVGRANIYSLAGAHAEGGVGATLTSRPAFGELSIEEVDQLVGGGSTIVLVDHDRLDPLRHVVLAAIGEGPSVRFGETKGDQVLALLKPLEDDLIDS